ncbi:MAG: hypothetical protein KUG69_13085 [Marinosulfonomonas sp.]|nr:hypothetical protein [Marinosulfonomonas sp.]
MDPKTLRPRTARVILEASCLILQEIILHLGMHKTGSTAIQSALRNYDDGDTIYAPLSDRNHSVPFFAAFSERYGSYHIFQSRGMSQSECDQARADAKQEIVTFLQGTDRRRVVFSGEGITDIEPAGVREMVAELRAHAKHIRAIVYVRHPVEFAGSNLQQALKGGNSSLTRGMQPRYQQKFAKFLEILGPENVEFRAFGKEQLRECNVVTDFAESLGLDRSKISSVTVNVSISLEAQKCVYLLNKTNCLTRGDKHLLAARAEFVRMMNSGLPGSMQIPTGYARMHLDAADIAWMESTSGLDLGSEDIGHEDPPLSSLEEYFSQLTEVSIDRLLRILADHGIEEEFDRDPVMLVNRLYYLCLVATAPKGSHRHPLKYFGVTEAGDFLVSLGRTLKTRITPK